MKFKKVKRTKGKLNTEIGIKDFYNEYTREAEAKLRSHINYKVYTSILKDFNKLLSEEIVYNNECYPLPYKLGLLGVIKFEQNFDEDNRYRWAVDWKKSKELGQIIYFENSDRYKWRWDKSTVKLKGKRYYQFKESRINSKAIKKAKMQNPRLDYYSKLAK